MRRFLEDRSGNVAITFALAVIPVLGLVGAAIDYSRAVNTRAVLQAATDAAVLQAAQISTSQTQTVQQQTIQSVIAARLAGSQLSGLNVSITGSGTNIQVRSTGTVPTIMARMLGKTSAPVSATAQAVWGVSSIEIALALDNTGSMSEVLGGQTKMQSLITAATNFITSMQNASTAQSTIKVALVPFDTDVNVGTGNLNASWVDRSGIGSYGQYTSGVNQLCSDWYAAYDQMQRLFCQFLQPVAGPWNSGNWKGCIWDREQPYAVMNTPWNVATSGTMFEPDPLRTSSCTLAPVVPLSTNWAALKTAIAAMQPSGSTNLNIGLAWGFGMLTPNVPFGGPAAIGTSGVSKAIVIMSDGWNTQDRWSTTRQNDSSDKADAQAKLDARTRQVCTNIKQAGISIYVVATADAATGLLRSCASNTSQYYSITDATQMNAVFQDIAGKLMQLRLAM